MVERYQFNGYIYFKQCIFPQVVCERKDVFASALAVARTLPLFNAKSTAPTISRTVIVEFLLVGEGRDKPLDEEDIACLTTGAESVRLAAKIVDIPCASMHTNQFLNVRVNIYYRYM